MTKTPTSRILPQLFHFGRHVPDSVLCWVFLVGGIDVHMLYPTSNKYLVIQITLSRGRPKYLQNTRPSKFIKRWIFRAPGISWFVSQSAGIQLQFVLICRDPQQQVGEIPCQCMFYVHCPQAKSDAFYMRGMAGYCYPSICIQDCILHAWANLHFTCSFTL